MINKISIYSIAYECPKMNRDKDCPSLKIEHLTFKERIDWIDELDVELEQLILKHHYLCTKRKIT